MSNLAERARAIGKELNAGYDGRRTEVALANLRTKLHRRRLRRIALGSATGALCLLAGTIWAIHGWRATGIQASTARADALFALSDGSVVTPIDPASRIVAKQVSPARVELELLSGGARFDVTPNREREFRVVAGHVQVIVVGTKFSVELQGERTAVAVWAGRVRVAWERGQQLLDPGERGVFPPFGTTNEAAPGRETEAPPDGAEAPTVQPRASAGRRGADGLALPEHGDPTVANRALQDRGKPANPDTTDGLLHAADAARSAGHAADAARYLEKALALHGSEARFAVVAFTLGRVRLADLSDPAGAATAFAQARAAAPQGPLAEDALAREIEARFRSGDKTRARALAEEYVKTWPTGSRIRAVRHFGGLP